MTARVVPLALSPEDAAAALGLSVDTIRRLIAGGQLETWGPPQSGGRGRIRITRRSIDELASRAQHPAGGAS